LSCPAMTSGGEGRPSPLVVAAPVRPRAGVSDGHSDWLGVAVGGDHIRRHAAAVGDGVAVLACPGPNRGGA
jgi:hypothetical protein